MEVGIGPICRKLDNAILARAIPANVAAAQVAAGRVIDADLPESTRPTFGLIMADLMDFTTKDWRATVKRIEWLLSWGMTSTLRTALIEIVRSLGYIGLAALLSGEAATGLTTITCEGSRLFLRGPRNKAGAYKIRKIPGAKFHPAVGSFSKAAWSVPAHQGDIFGTIVVTYWPNFTGLDEALVTAKTVVVEAPAAAATPVKALPTVTISPVVNGRFQVATPFNVGFLVEVKKLPYSARKWNGLDKVWDVDAQYLDAVKALIKTHYQVDLAIATAAA